MSQKHDDLHQSSSNDADKSYQSSDQVSKEPRISPRSKMVGNQHSHSKFNQSLQQMKQLLNSAADTEKVNENPYKTVNQSSTRSRPVINSNAPLPTPDELRELREARRRARIDELERLDTLDAVEKSHQASHYIHHPLTRDNVDIRNNRIKSSQTNAFNTAETENLAVKVPTELSDATTHEAQIPDVEDTFTSSISDKGKVTSVTGEFTGITDDKAVTGEAIGITDGKANADETTGTTDDKSKINEDTVIDTTSSDALPDTSVSKQDEQPIEEASDSESLAALSETDAAPLTRSELLRMRRMNKQDSANKDTANEDITSDTLVSPVDKNNIASTDEMPDFIDAAPLDDVSNDSLSDAQKAKPKKKHIWVWPWSFKRRNKKTDPDYSLDELDNKEKVIFGFNVFFNVLKRFVIYLLLLGMLFAAMAGGIGAGYFAYLVSQTEPPSREQMAEQINRVDQQSTLHYADGSQIANVRADIVRQVAELKDISQYIIDGLVATEDEYFYEHPGVVPKAILRATLQALLTSGSGTGGSTLTQQLVKQQLLTNDVTFFRKANEILLALRVENHFSKDEILTAYLNISPFGRNNSGDNIAGILSASQGIFGKSPKEVNLPQAAFLVGLPQAPYAYTPYDQTGELQKDHSAGIERMKEVLFRMYRTEKITKEEYESAIKYDITKDFIPTVHRSKERQTYLYHAMMHGAIEQLMRLNIAEKNLTWEQVNADPEWYNEFYYAAEEQLRKGGYRVHTTIDKGIYDQLQASAAEHIDELGATYDGVYTNPDTGEETYYVESVQSGVVVMDNTTGRVLGFVSGTDYENNQIDHAFRMRRSPGSTIKPLAVYGPAVEHNLINPSTIIPDTAFEKTYDDGTTWTPTNYGGVVSGNFLTARTALLRSDNLPAVRVYEELIKQNIPVFEYLKKMGFDAVDAYTKEETQNLAFSLGGVTTGPTVFEQTRAFTTFANKGKYVDGYFIERIEDAFGNTVYQHDAKPVDVFSEDTNYLMVDMLRDTNTEGTGRTAAANMTMGGDWIAKSGISENSRDVWYIASTPKITIGTWIGYDNRYVDYNIDINDGYDRESVRIQKYWANLANELYAKYPDIFGTDQVFEKPDTVQETGVVQSTGTLPGTININGTPVSLSNPVVNEVFKTTNPAPALNYNFMFGATEEDTQRFWNTYIQQAQEALRRQQAAQQSRRSSSSSSGNNETNNQNENQPQQETTTVAPQTSE
ncbi:transglycosylase domain-containing protein [Tuanshanicoccus lijuaniae]|uniref:transglycosylase domain-containing protein n=1 Tax=Aerococcaceae bacterium zg-1292 TaxID=2774330 RepID=UPI004062897A